MKRTFTPSRLALRALAPVALAAVAVTACSSSSSSTASSIVLTPRIVITSVKGNTESALIAAMYARVLQDAGFRISMKDPVELDRAGYYAALQRGDFQLIPEFTHDLQTFLYSQPGAPSAPTTVRPTAPATTAAPITVAPATTTADTGAATTTTAAATTTAAGATTTTVKAINNGRTVTEQIAAIKAALAKTTTVGTGTAAELKQVFACTPATMKANQRTQFITLTDLAGLAPKITLGAPASFTTDQDSGLPAFTYFYGGTFKSVVTLDDAGLADALTKGTVDCAVLNSMNPLITTAQLTVLDDDKVMEPANAAVPLIATSVAVGQAMAALDTLDASLTTARLNQMVNEVNTNHTDPDVVANAFMNTL